MSHSQDVSFVRIPDTEADLSEVAPNPKRSEGGSSISEATFNFTNCVIGAGIIGTGHAIAASGLLVSYAVLTAIALLTKASLTMLITLEETHGTSGYEEIGFKAFSLRGKLAVLFAKLLYSFGCIVAYIVVLKNNMSAALVDIFISSTDTSPNIFSEFIQNDNYVAIFLSTFVILPLCLNRRLDKLASFSFISICAVFVITIIVLLEFIVNPNDEVRIPSTSLVKDVLEVRIGIISSLGSFVFAFVSQHCCHITYQSMAQRNLKNWETVSRNSISIAYALVVIVGSTVYFTFYEKTSSDMFLVYPKSKAIDFARVLLSVTMLLSFPLPFFTCREMIVVLFDDITGSKSDGSDSADTNTNENANASEQSIDDGETENGNNESGYIAPRNGITSSGFTSLTDSTDEVTDNQQKPNHTEATSADNQLPLKYHILLTLTIWLITITVAISAPSLGSVLDLVGSLSGTLIAFVLPACISIKLGKVTVSSAVMLGLGLVMFVVGSFFSVLKIIEES